MYPVFKASNLVKYTKLEVYILTTYRKYDDIFKKNISKNPQTIKMFNLVFCYFPSN